MESGLLLHGRKFCLAMYVTHLIDQVRVNTLDCMYKLFETVRKSDPAGPKEKEPSRFGQNYQLTSSNVCDLLFGLQLVRTGSDVTERVTM